MGLTYFSKSRKTKGARRQSCQQSKGMTLNVDGKVTNVGRSAKFIIHSDVFIACGSKLQHGLARFSLSIQRPFNAERWAVFLPSGPGQNTPNLACCGRRTKETLESGCYLVRPHGKRRDWTQHHCSNFLCVIDTCISLVEMQQYELNLFSFPVWSNLIFQPIFLSQKKNWSVIRPGVTADLDPPTKLSS